ncbi:Oidioi.mRNA.OKI2018_I69.XSR.g16804.t1.cds [Oikopleura dioica]|uniref:Oidioi.mRNA.OKI2018_I69.XSR.g16804.t1.cds n=1 Tax=Oikopleura dioica TaxID=34765 RepID=A0ABN7SHA3_OIKDI|nr:Oidioi.mRNA.OKI2018_I69.XSR.g16804.t1.cds [Oikopleura dioica]
MSVQNLAENELVAQLTAKVNLLQMQVDALRFENAIMQEELDARQEEIVAFLDRSHDILNNALLDEDEASLYSEGDALSDIEAEENHFIEIEMESDEDSGINDIDVFSTDSENE